MWEKQTPYIINEQQLIGKTEVGKKAKQQIFKFKYLPTIINKAESWTIRDKVEYHQQIWGFPGE